MYTRYSQSWNFVKAAGSYQKGTRDIHTKKTNPHLHGPWIQKDSILNLLVQRLPLRPSVIDACKHSVHSVAVEQGGVGGACGPKQGLVNPGVLVLKQQLVPVCAERGQSTSVGL